MQITLTTPALLFPAISLLLVAYTNRFLALGGRIRALHDRYRTDRTPRLAEQIISLRRRVLLIRNMQLFGVAALFCCVFCMFTLFANLLLAGKILFGLSLFLLMASLGLSLREIQISVEALHLELSDMERDSSR